MQVTITFKDNSSFTTEDAISNHSKVYDYIADVETAPDNKNPESYIYFALQNMISEEQIAAYFDNKYEYEVIEAKLIKRVSETISEILNQVLKDNIEKCQ